MTSIEQLLADHVARLQADDLPEGAVAAVGRLFIDTAAAMLSGFGNPECRGIADRLLAGTAGPCSVVGRQTGTDPGTAALVNGIFAHWCEWDDVHDAAGIHGSAVIFPALLAASEQAGARSASPTGRAITGAVVAAYDVAARIGAGLNAKAAHGWMTTGAAASIGAAGGAAKLLGLNPAGILSAMAIAATGGGLSRQSLADRTSGKNALCGMAAKNAVDAVRLAAAGIVGAPHFFGGVFGLNALHAGGRAELQLEDLGRHFSITEAGLKPYPSCRSTHPAIDVMLELLAERPGAGETVAAIDFAVPDLPFALCGRPFAPGDNPRVSAQFSIPFTSALALKQGEVTAPDFLPDRVLRFAAEHGTLIRNIGVAAADPSVGGSATVPFRARVTMRNGEVLERITTTIAGSPARPMTPEQNVAKLRAAADGVLDAVAVEQLHEVGADLSATWPSPAVAILRSAAATF